MPHPHLEGDAGLDEGASTRVAKAEAPSYLTNGLAGGVSAANGPKDFADQPLDSRWRTLVKRQDHVYL